MNKSIATIKVYAADRKTLLAEISSQCRSIGAAKAANVKACQLGIVNGRYAWIAKHVRR